MFTSKKFSSCGLALWIKFIAQQWSLHLNDLDSLHVLLKFMIKKSNSCVRATASSACNKVQFYLLLPAIPRKLTVNY